MSWRDSGPIKKVVVIYTVAGNTYNSIPYTDEQVNPFIEAMERLTEAKSIAIDCYVTESGSVTVKRVFNPINIEHMYIRESTQ